MRPNVAYRLLALAFACAPLSAQGPGVALRFHPAVGSQLPMLGDVTIAETFIGFPTVPDSATAEVTLRMHTTRRVLAREGAAYRVRLTLDSVRGQMRLPGGNGRDLPPPDLGSAEMLVDSVARATPPATPRVSPADSARRQGIWASLPMEDLAFPATPVQAGYRWSVTAAREMSGAGLAGIPLAGAKKPPVLQHHVDAVVDSVVPRGADTLAYVSYVSRVTPVSYQVADSTGQASITIRGGGAGIQIWSTGWSGWVSSSSRARMEVLLRGADATGHSLDAKILLDLTSRGQVRF